MAVRQELEGNREREDIKIRRNEPDRELGTGEGGGIGGLLSLILSLLGGGKDDPAASTSNINPAFTTGGRSLFGDRFNVPPTTPSTVSPSASGGQTFLGKQRWDIMLPMLLSIFGGLFEKKEDPLSSAMEMMGMMNKLGIQQPYQSPYLPQMGEAAFRAAMNQLQQTSGWGWPADRQPAGGTDWIRQMLENAPTGTPLDQRIARRTG